MEEERAIAALIKSPELGEWANYLQELNGYRRECGLFLTAEIWLRICSAAEAAQE